MKTSKLRTLKTYAVALAGGLMLLVGYSQKSEAVAVVGECASPGTFNALLGTTCTIGDKTFSNFSFLSQDIAADRITYETIDGVDGYWGFRFQFSLTAVGAGASKDFALGYKVSCTDGSDCIDSLHAQITAGGANGGIASLAETYLGPNGFSDNFYLFSPGGPVVYNKDFDPVAWLSISKDVNATCPDVTTAPCSATISVVWNTVDQVPEPGSLALLGLGLAGMGFAIRRRKV